MHRVALVVPLVFFVAASCGEKAALPAPKLQSGQLLVMRTDEPQLAAAVASALGRSDAVGEKRAGHWQLAMDKDRKLDVVGRDEAGVLFEAVLDPAALMDAYAEEVEQMTPQVRGALTMGLQQTGAEPKHVATLAKQVLAFPRQIRRLAVKVVGDVSTMTSADFDATIEMEPVPGSPFAEFVTALRPASKGAPILGGDGSMSFSASIDPGAMRMLFAPLREFLLTIMAKSESDRAAWASVIDETMASSDGTFGMVMRSLMVTEVLGGLSDSQRMKALIASDGYEAIMRAMRMPDPDTKVEFDRAGVVHRDATLSRSRMTGGALATATADGAVEQFSGVVGEYLLTVVNRGEPATRAIVDRVLDGNIRRAPLRDGALAILELDMGKFLAEAARTAGHDAEMPRVDKQVTFTLDKNGGALRLRIGMH